ncbi:hypothetical protein [uncultured Marinobacter sp.]|uniref:hypothetical protein n=1 Tax=uncultured Marinobacter sp. TaxID=187379 RepID=UPI0030D92BB6
MSIDIERLKVDREYWEEVCTHADYDTYCTLAKGFGPGDRCNHCIPRPKAPEAEWVDGLPGVGVECELLRGKEWVPVEITGKGKRVTVFRRLCNAGLEEMTEADASEFRPLRTPEQRQRDELNKLVRKAYLDGACDHVGGLSAVTDAILSRYNLEPKP